MTWPTSDVSTTNNDSSADSPATWRADSKDLADKFNQIRNHVSAFGQSLIDDADAAAARTTMAAAKSGANTDITSLSAPGLGAATATTAAVDTNTTQVATTAFVLAQAASAAPVKDGSAAVVGTSTRYARADHVHPEASIGAGQTWSDYVGSRALSTTYTNSTGRPIVVSVWGSMPGGASVYLTAVIDGANRAVSSQAPNNAGFLVALSFVVPAGSTYRVNTSNSLTLNAWNEFR